MIKNLRKNVFLLFIVLCTIISSVFIISKNINYNKDHDVNLRTVTLEEKQVNAESYFEAFDDYSLTCDGRTLSFDGNSSIYLNDLYDLDLVSEEDNVPVIVTKYLCDYDMLNSIVTLSLAIVNGEEVEIIDKIYGVLVLNDNNEFDVSFDVDGEVLLLSELDNVELIENCGFFKNLASKVKSAVVTAAKKVNNAVVTAAKEVGSAVVSTVENVVDTTKKVCKTNAGKIGTIATVAACAVAGVVCAVIPGCQVGTAVFVGMAIGYIGAATTAAVSTYQQDGQVDWNAVQTYGQCGQIVGGAVAGITYGITSSIANVVSTGAQNAATQASNSSYCNNGNCFIEGTLVLTNVGYKQIEDITIGDYVLSYNEETNNNEYKEVTTLFRNVTNQWIHLIINNEEIICTPGHLFYTLDKGWITALEINTNEKLLDSNNNIILVNHKYIEYLDDTATTYNFEVADNHTYYISDEEVLTHNTCNFDYDNFHTGRTTPENLGEQIYMDEVKSNPASGKILDNCKLNDPRFEGMDVVKMEQIHVIDKDNQIVVHYVWDRINNIFFDFKFK